MSTASNDICKKTGKLAYRDHLSAVGQIQRMRRKPKWSGNCEAYRCNFCGLWHIGRRYGGRRAHG